MFKIEKTTDERLQKIAMTHNPKTGSKNVNKMFRPPVKISKTP